mmetsp:Transcript_120112/g.299624  ORF Transcript_120112/g.299624 Transcript_120112/m.299624 type:complete len:247 (-) Transcript_120112:246-986(-)
MSGRNRSTVFGTASILMSDCKFATEAVLSVSFASRVTWAVEGPRKSTALSNVRRHESRKVPSTLSSASGDGYSGSSSSVRVKQTSAGVFSSMKSPKTSAAYGWKRLARWERMPSLLQRCSSSKSRSSGSSHATLPLQVLPRYPSSTSSGNLANLPSSPSPLNLFTSSSVRRLLWQTRRTLKPLLTTQPASSWPRPSESVLGATSRSKLLSSPPSPGLAKFSAAFTFLGSKRPSVPQMRCTQKAPSS